MTNTADPISINTAGFAERPRRSLRDLLRAVLTRRSSRTARTEEIARAVSQQQQSLANPSAIKLPWLLVMCAFSIGALRAHETCSSPYLARIEGQEEFVYVWTLGDEKVGDGSDKLVTIDVKPGWPTYGKVVHTHSVGGRREALPGRVLVPALSNAQDKGGRTALVGYSNDGSYIATHWLPAKEKPRGAVGAEFADIKTLLLEQNAAGERSRQ